MRTIPFTKQGYEEIKKELEAAIVKRPDAVKQLTRGREMGDLSENGLYKAAKQELNDIDRQIRHLKNLVLYGKPILPVNSEVVQIGSKIVVVSQNNEKEYLIVGEYEADPKQNKISNKSPIGHAFMGRKVGEEIKVRIPSGEETFKIKSIK